MYKSNESNVLQKTEPMKNLICCWLILSCIILLVSSGHTQLISDFKLFNGRWGSISRPPGLAPG